MHFVKDDNKTMTIEMMTDIREWIKKTCYPLKE
jgi:hypothetical protein